MERSVLLGPLNLNLNLNLSLYTQNKLFAGSSLPAEQKHYQRIDGPTDGRTHPLIESWLTTKKAMFGHRIGSLVGDEVVLVIEAI